MSKKPQRPRYPALALVAAALVLVGFGYLLHGLFSGPDANLGLSSAHSLSAMSVFHVVAFKLADAKHLPDLSLALLALKEECHINGRKYIRSAHGGKQSSTEGHEKGMQVVFLLEFEKEADYYVNEDPAHNAFKIPSWGVEDVTVLDFTPGAF